MRLRDSLQPVLADARRVLAVGLFALAAVTLAAPVAAETGPWAVSPHSRLRLLSAGPNPDGTMLAAIEIELDDGWKTYWRTPGDAGLAPHFDFSGSSNVRSARVQYPPPVRWNDGFTISNIYERRVVLPVEIRLANPSATTMIKVAAQIGVCETVCILTESAAEVTVPAGFTDARAARTINEAVARLPQPPIPGVFEVVSVDRVDGTEDEPVFEVVLTAPNPRVDLFVEGPQDWYAAEPVLVGGSRDQVVYRVGFDRLGSTVALADAVLTVTAVADGQAIEQPFELR